MEKRAILAAVLMAGAADDLSGCSSCGSPRRSRPPAPEDRDAGRHRPATAPLRLPAPERDTAPPPPKEAAAVPERKAIVETPLYRAAIAHAGGADQGVGSPLSRREADGAARRRRTTGARGRSGRASRRGRSPSTVDREALKLDKDDAAGRAAHGGEDGFGIRVSRCSASARTAMSSSTSMKVENAHTVPQGVELAHGVERARRSGRRSRSSLRGRGRSMSCAWRRARSGLAVNTWRAPWTTCGDGRWVGFESGMAPVEPERGLPDRADPAEQGIKVPRRKREETKTTSARP